MKKNCVSLIVCLVVACLCLPAFADAPRGFIGDTGTGWDTTSGLSSYGADSGLPGRLPVNTVSGGGISTDGWTHNTSVFDPPGGMWLSDGGVVGWSTHYVAYAFDTAYSLAEIWIWNWNESGWTQAGMKNITIVTDAGTGWGSGPTFTGITLPQASGSATEPVSLVVNTGGALVNGVLIYSALGSEHNWSSGTIPNDGLSEVRFYIPEPATIGILSLGSLLALKRRRS